jgi:putative ABC transport system substrate-binding protein
MKKNYFCIALCALLFAICDSAQAQQPTKIPRIGFLPGSGEPSTPGPHVEAFRQELRDLGYVDGKNILVEYRYIQGKSDRVPSLVAELVQLKVDALVLVTPPSIRAAKQATKTIPIIMVTTQDPVAAGIVDSLARPGGNITGLTRLTVELSGKRLELFKEIVPGMSRVGVLWPQGSFGFREYEPAARALKIQLHSLQVQRQNPDIEGAFRDATKERVNGLITVTNSLLNPYTKRIADLAIKNRLPSMYETSYYVEAGGLVSYSANDESMFRRAAVFVDKILKGTKPADLPVEQPMKFEFVINLKTAKQIGLTIPQWTLMKADKVIR